VGETFLNTNSSLDTNDDYGKEQRCYCQRLLRRTLHRSKQYGAFW
jgi:hypothetical protein